MRSLLHRATSEEEKHKIQQEYKDIIGRMGDVYKSKEQLE